MNKIVSWEQGLAESFHLGKTARASGKMRHGQFRKALQEAAIEESLPKERRLDWNHQGGAAVAEGGAGAAGGSSLPCPKKVRRGRKRRRVENTTSGNIRAPPAATKTNSKNNSVGGETAGPPAFGRVVEKKAARRNLSFTAPTLQQNPPPAGQSTSTGNTGTSQDDVVHSTKSKSAANVNTSSGGRGIPVEQQRQPAAAAATAIAAIVPTAAQDESADGEMYCKVQREVRLKASAADDSSSTSPVLVDVGFVRLDSRLTATFAVCRQVIEEELASENAALAPNWEWRFLVPNLGPLSKKQESKFGPMLAFLKNATCAVEPLKNVGNGSLQNPVQVTLVDAPQVVVDASG